MRKVSAAVTAIAALALGTAAWAGPFGVSKGDPISKYRSEPVPSAPNQYKLLEVPTPHPEADFYVVRSTTQTGICTIAVSMKSLDNDAYGSNLRSQFNGLAEALTGKYGAPTDKYDQLSAGSIWKEPRDFASALTRGERVLRYLWRAERGLKMPDGIATIGLLGEGLSNSVTYVRIVYEFDNKADCDAIDKQDRNRGL